MDSGDYTFTRRRSGDPPKLSDFKKVADIGKGSFGAVVKY